MSGASVKLTWNGKTAAADVIQAALNGAQSAMEHVRAESLKEVPRDTHALAQSAKVERRGNVIDTSYNQPYALKQHEEMGYNHPRGGKAKYLEDPFNREKENIIKIIEQEVRRNT